MPSRSLKFQSHRRLPHRNHNPQTTNIVCHCIQQFTTTMGPVSRDGFIRQTVERSCKTIWMPNGDPVWVHGWRRVIQQTLLAFDVYTHVHVWSTHSLRTAATNIDEDIEFRIEFCYIAVTQSSVVLWRREHSLPLRAHAYFAVYARARAVLYTSKSTAHTFLRFAFVCRLLIKYFNFTVCERASVGEQFSAKMVHVAVQTEL